MKVKSILFTTFIIIIFTCNIYSYTIKLHLNSGWNLKGSYLDINLSDTDFNNIPSEITSIWKWNGNNWEIWSKNSTILDLLNKYNIKKFSIINSGEGFWINSKSSIILPLYGTKNINKIHYLKNNWSLISLKDKYEISIDKFLKYPINTIWKWDKDKWKVWSPKDSILSLLKNYGIEKIYKISPNEGFWINIKSNNEVVIDLYNSVLPPEIAIKNIYNNFNDENLDKLMISLSAVSNNNPSYYVWKPLQYLISGYYFNKKFFKNIGINLDNLSSFNLNNMLLKILENPNYPSNYKLIFDDLLKNLYNADKLLSSALENNIETEININNNEIKFDKIDFLSAKFLINIIRGIISFADSINLNVLNWNVNGIDLREKIKNHEVITLSEIESFFKNNSDVGKYENINKLIIFKNSLEKAKTYLKNILDYYKNNIDNLNKRSDHAFFLEINDLKIANAIYPVISSIYNSFDNQKQDLFILHFNTFWTHECDEWQNFIVKKTTNIELDKYKSYDDIYNLYNLLNKKITPKDVFLKFYKIKKLPFEKVATYIVIPEYKKEIEYFIYDPYTCNNQ